MFHRYRHEAEFYPALSRIPLDVRMKLDLTGQKISLEDWLACSFEERIVLCHLPMGSMEERQAFRAYIDFLCRKNKGAPAAITEVLPAELWSETNIPRAVAQKAASCFTAVGLSEWSRWRPHQRYALYKTAISKSQPEAFADILDELRAVADPSEAKL